MAEAITTPDPVIEQRRQASINFINEIDYHILVLRSQIKATGLLVGEVNDTLRNTDGGSDLEAVVVMFWEIRDRISLMVDAQDRRCSDGA